MTPQRESFEKFCIERWGYSPDSLGMFSSKDMYLCWQAALSQPNETPNTSELEINVEHFRNSRDRGYFKMAELEQANKVLEAKCNTLEVNLSVIEGGLDAHNAMDKALREVDANTIADLTAKVEKMREALIHTISLPVDGMYTFKVNKFYIEKTLEECKS